MFDQVKQLKAQRASYVKQIAVLNESGVGEDDALVGKLEMLRDALTKVDAFLFRLEGDA